VTRQNQIRPVFVTFAPDVLDPGVLYISIEYAAVLHACCCGCGNKVVTPLAPERWCLTYDGKSISLDPSIGNWSFACQSHYWIERNAVIWDRPFSSAEIAEVRAADRRDMTRAAPRTTHRDRPATPTAHVAVQRQTANSWWRRLIQRRRD
jgi:hypothetical protein